MKKRRSTIRSTNGKHHIRRYFDLFIDSGNAVQRINSLLYSLKASKGSTRAGVKRPKDQWAFNFDTRRSHAGERESGST